MNGSQDDPHRYDDIINHPRPVSKTHPPMALANRAAQFAPFAALSGYDAAIKETARLTAKRIELDDDQKIILSGRLQLLQDNIREHPQAAITYFQPDARKSGGAYEVAMGNVKKVDAHERIIVMTSGETIPIDQVIAIEGTLFEDGDVSLP